jgi:protein SCO1/2
MRRLSSIILICLTAVFVISCEEEVTTLPYLGTHNIIDGDTSYYQIPKFWFTNQDGLEVTHETYENKVFVADFFFTNCPSICPMLTSQLARLQDKLIEDKLWGDVMIISHSVDAARDSVETLRAYADKINADTQYWNFVTGAKKRIHDHAEHGYFLTAFESDTAAGGFFHTDQFALIDRNRHIRGYYDGTSTTEVDQLFEDIQLLVSEEWK